MWFPIHNQFLKGELLNLFHFQQLTGYIAHKNSLMEKIIEKNIPNFAVLDRLSNRSKKHMVQNIKLI